MDIQTQIDQLEDAYCNTLDSFVDLYDSQNGWVMDTFVGHGGKHEKLIHDIETYWYPETDEGRESLPLSFKV